MHHTTPVSAQETSTRAPQEVPGREVVPSFPVDQTSYPHEVHVIRGTPESLGRHELLQRRREASRDLTAPLITFPVLRVCLPTRRRLLSYPLNSAAIIALRVPTAPDCSPFCSPQGICRDTGNDVDIDRGNGISQGPREDDLGFGSSQISPSPSYAESFYPARRPHQMRRHHRRCSVVPQRWVAEKLEAFSDRAGGEA